MPIWNDVRLEIDNAVAGGRNPTGLDTVRRVALAEYEAHTGRPLVFYGSAFTQPRQGVSAYDIQITPADKDGWVEATSDLPSGPLDIMLHSPGGMPSVAEWVVTFLRERFGPIRAVVPHSAKSAATMIALGCDEIVIDERGELGPTDPQMMLGRPSPAQAIIDQFKKAQTELQADPSTMPAWIPILQQVGPSLLAESQNAIDLSKNLVFKWLEEFMFAGDPDASAKADRVATWISNHNEFQSHARQATVRDLLAHDIRVVDLRAEEHAEYRAIMWKVWTHYSHMFERSNTFKVVENSRGQAMMRQLVQMPVAMQMPSPPVIPAAQRSLTPQDQRARRGR